MSLLGRTLSAAEMSPYPAKVATVRDFPIPHNVEELQGFLGQAFYYGKLIKNLAIIASPLYLLTPKSHGLG